MGILKKLFEWLAKFFGSKAGKNTLKAMAGGWSRRRCWSRCRNGRRSQEE